MSDPEWKAENPDFDDVVLDDEFFEAAGLNREEIMKEITSTIADADPEGMALTPEMFSQLSSSNPSKVREQAADLEIWGPEVCFLLSTCSMPGQT